MSKKIKLKKVYIVGTGIAASLIAKTLTDVVLSDNNELINRSNANDEFIKKLLNIGYPLKKEKENLYIFFEKIEAMLDTPVSLEDESSKNDYEIIKKIWREIRVKNSLRIEEKANFFEKEFFEYFYSNISIIMFEAGLNDGVKLEASDNFKAYASYMEKFFKETAKVPNSPYPKLPQADSPNVLDIRNLPDIDSLKNGYLLQKGPLPFLSDHIRVGGGTTMHWLGSTPRMLPNDFDIFKAETGTKQEYYKWPINYDELKPYYEIAEYEIGVSAATENQKYPGVNSVEDYYGTSIFPMNEIPQSYMDKYIEKGLEKKKITLEGNKEEINILLTPTPQGRNSTPNENYKKLPKLSTTEDSFKFRMVDSQYSYEALGSVWNPYMGERCEGNASCVPICPVQAKYNALKTLKKAFYIQDWSGELTCNDNISIESQSVVYKLGVGNNQKISAIYVRRYKDKNDYLFDEVKINTEDSIVILAANALENPKILLNSKYINDKGCEVTVANSSDQVGRNLMDHQVMLTWGLAEEPVYPFRGPGSTSNISSFRDGKFRQNHAAWITPLDNWGWGWPTFAPATDFDELIEKGKYGHELRKALNEKVTKQVLFHFEIEQLPNPDNRITIDERYLDPLGIPRPIINYSISDYEKEGLKQAKLVSEEIFKMLEIKDYTEYKQNDPSATMYDGKLYNFNGAGHIVGTHRMGTKKENSVTNDYCRSWDHQNLYIVGAGSMCTLGTSNPTLTLAAIAIRSVESILKDMDE